MTDPRTGREIVPDSVRRLLDRGVTAELTTPAQSVVVSESEGEESEQAESGVSVLSSSSADRRARGIV